MGDELIQLAEGAFVEQQVEALAGGEAAPLVLGLDALLPAAELGFFFELSKVCGLGVKGHGNSKG